MYDVWLFHTHFLLYYYIALHGATLAATEQKHRMIRSSTRFGGAKDAARIESTAAMIRVRRGMVRVGDAARILAFDTDFGIDIIRYCRRMAHRSQPPAVGHKKPPRANAGSFCSWHLFLWVLFSFYEDSQVLLTVTGYPFLYYLIFLL